MMTLSFLMFMVPAATLPEQTARDVDVTFRSGSITLAGTLSLPIGPGPFPAVVLLSGCGAQNRDEELFGFRPFKIIAAFIDRTISSSVP